MIKYIYRMITYALIANLCSITNKNVIKKCSYEKGVRLSLQERKAHLLQQASMLKQMPQSIKHILYRAQRHPLVQKDIAQRLQSSNKLKFNWSEIELVLRKEQRDLLLVGFGSLLNKRFSYQPNINIPCIAFGIQRIYNIGHNDPDSSAIGLPTCGYDHEHLRLNAQLSDRHFLNGVLLQFNVDSYAFQDIKEREKSYYLVPIKVVLYQQLLQGSIIPADAYILIAENNKYHFGEPHIIYNSIVMDGFYDIESKGNPGFLALYLDTTYLVDSVTTVRSWIEWILRTLTH